MHEHASTHTHTREHIHTYTYIHMNMHKPTKYCSQKEFSLSPFPRASVPVKESCLGLCLLELFSDSLNSHKDLSSIQELPVFREWGGHICGNWSNYDKKTCHLHK